MIRISMPDTNSWEHARLLACLAHPDDESFGMGGTLALYARRGAEVHLVCATRGEAGTVSPEDLGAHASVADLRETELRCAAQTLGLKDVQFLGYRDSGMAGSDDNRHPQALASAPLAEVTARLVDHLRRIRPQVVLTFDPRGGYGHPDHIAMYQATVRAFHLAAEPTGGNGTSGAYTPQKLYFQVFPRTNLRRFAWLLPLVGMNPRRFGRNQDIDLLEIAAVSFPAHAQIDIRSTYEAKQRASDCHSSQGRIVSGGLVGWLFRPTRFVESYMRAHPPAPQGLRETDLFEGVLTG
jgi:LmbE family N-acetylglucosaminyl deacetylase